MTPIPASAGSEEERSLANNISYRISSFIRSFTTVLFVGMGMAAAGLLLKYYAVTGGSFVFVFAMAVLVMLFMVQIGLSFFYVITNVRLALLGAVTSAALALGFMALIFRYQNWVGWQIMFIIAFPLFLISAIVIGMYLLKRYELTKPHRNFLYRNLLFPYIFILVLGIMSLMVDAALFNKEQNDRLQQSPVRNNAEEDTTGMWRAY